MAEEVRALLEKYKAKHAQAEGREKEVLEIVVESLSYKDVQGEGYIRLPRYTGGYRVTICTTCMLRLTEAEKYPVVGSQYSRIVKTVAEVDTALEEERKEKGAKAEEAKGILLKEVEAFGKRAKIYGDLIHVSPKRKPSKAKRQRKKE